MKQTFTIYETYFLILLIIVTFIHGIYMLYIYTVDAPILKQIYAGKDIFNKVKESYNKYPFFTYTEYVLNIMYLFSALYFTLNNKIKNILFGLVCLFMFLRAVFFIFRKFILTKTSSDLTNKLLKQIHKVIIVDNLLSLFVAIYFMKIIFL